MPKPVILRSGRLAARFFRAADRYAHEIGIDTPDGFMAMFSSIEGTQDDDWPPSPPFQHLHVEQREGRPVAMLIGKAGQGHWSAAVEVTAAGMIGFDIACRCTGTPGRMGSTYRAVTTGKLTSAGEALMTAVVNDMTLSCEPLAASGRTVNETTPVELLITPASTAVYTIPATLRWKYRFALREQ